MLFIQIHSFSIGKCPFLLVTVLQLEKFEFFNHLGLETKSDFDRRTSQIKSHSIRASKRYLNDKSQTHGREIESIFRFNAKNLESNLKTMDLQVAVFQFDDQLFLEWHVLLMYFEISFPANVKKCSELQS